MQVALKASTEIDALVREHYQLDDADLAAQVVQQANDHMIHGADVSNEYDLDALASARLLVTLDHASWKSEAAPSL